MVNDKESSSSEGEWCADEARFRVRVCLRRFYSERDVRARAYVCVAPRRRVDWLARRLRRLFRLPALRLRCRGHLLPPREPLAVLRPDDPVEVLPADAELDDAAAAPDDVDSVHEETMTNVEELERSPTPAYPEDLMETKRRALLLLEQVTAEPAARGAEERAPESAAPPRRRRVRRRRRVPPPGGAAADEDDEPAPAAVAGDDEPAPAAVFREPAAVAMVLRNDLQPRAPRVVHPLADRVTPTLLDTTPTEVA